MTVYVDNMYLFGMGRLRHRGVTMKMSHLIADTETELHSMARKINVKHQWYQGDHYDISLEKRKLAVLHGAIEITLRECAIMMANKRAGYPMGNPKTCIKISQKRTAEARLLEEFL